LAKRRTKKPFSILVVDPEPVLTRRLHGALPPARAEIARTAALEDTEESAHDLLLVTGAALRAAGDEAPELLRMAQKHRPAAQVVFLVDDAELERVLPFIDGTRHLYRTLPIDGETLGEIVRDAMARRPRHKQDETPAAAPGDELIGQSTEMQQVYRQVRQAAMTDIPVLICGDTGTGKELVAAAIHRQSERRDAPYVPVHIGSLPQELVASELFGHEKGSFTGAADKRVGRFEQAAGGSIFLDEISAIDQRTQVSLLRLIEQQRFYRLGGRRKITSDVRIIAATNEDLAEAVEEGRFRQDLYYRLDVFRIELPPLRERRGDIPRLIDAFLRRYNAKFGKDIQGITPECISRLESCEWPGNVRELKNVVQRAALVCEGDVLTLKHLPPRFRGEKPPPGKLTIEIGTPLEEVEREMIRRALAAVGGNRTRAAELLGISRRALYNKMARHGIE
jgi:DNA-binding NtrC family response regulator